jgi:RimJ/RimL family protein N-acetyltransferase
VTDAEAVGIVTLKKIVIGDSAEVAYWIGTSHQGLGYAKAAGRAALAYAFETLDAKYVHAHYLRASNPASERVLTALGFAPDHSRTDFPTRAAGPDDRFYQAFPDDVWTFMRLDRAAWRSGAPA